MKNIFYILIFISFVCASCSQIEMPDMALSANVQTGDTLLKKFEFKIAGASPDLLSIYPGDPGHNYRYSAMWLNSQEFKKQFDENTAIAGACYYQFEAPAGGRYDTLQIKKFVEDGYDAFYIQVYSPYSKSYYHRRFKDGVFNPLLNLPIEVFAGMENNGSDNKLKKFDEGVNVLTKYKMANYTYGYAGIFEAFVVATNMSDKQYVGDGYITKRFSSIDEYGMMRQVSGITVTVGQNLQLELVSQFTNAFQIAVKVPANLKSKAMSLTKEDFELREFDTNKIVPITGLINQIKNLGWYGVQAKYTKGKKYKLRPIKTFYGDYIEITIP